MVRKSFKLIGALILGAFATSFVVTSCQSATPPIIDKVEEIDLEEENKKLLVSIPNSSTLFLKDIGDENIVITGYDSSKFVVDYIYSKDLNKNELLVKYRIREIDKVLFSNYIEKIFNDFKIDTSIPLIPLNPSIVVDISIQEEINILEGNSGILPIKLNKTPNANIELTLLSDNDEISFKNKTILFNNEDYDIEKNIEVLTNKNKKKEDQHSVISVLYNERVIKTIKVNIVNIDKDYDGEIVVSSGVLSINVGEQSSIQVKLSKAPIGDFLVNISVDNEGVTLDKEILIFNESNYNNEQSIEITIQKYFSPTINKNALITLSSFYDNKTFTKTINVNILNVQTPYLGDILLSQDSISMNSNEETKIGVKLSKAPANNFTISVSLDNNNILIDKTELTFDSNNFNIEQFVTIKAVDFSSEGEIRTTNIVLLYGDEYTQIMKTVHVSVKSAYVPYQGEIITSTNNIRLNVNEQTTIGIKLSEAPTKEMTINVSIDNNNVALDKNTLVFSESNYYVEQFVTINALDFIEEAGTKNSVITLSNADLSNVFSKIISVTISKIEAPYDGEILLSIENLSLNVIEEKTIGIKLSSAPKSDITIYASIDNTNASLNIGSLIFNSTNYNVEQFILIKAGDFTDGATSKKSVVTISSENLINKTITINITKPTEEKAEIIKPYASGFITAPVNYYTCYYDINFEITKLYVEFNQDGNWIELTKDYNSYTSSSCMVEIPYNLRGTNPVVTLKATYDQKIKKIEGTPTFTLEGYKIKGTVGGYSEYFAPLATKPTCLISATNEYEIKDYLTFSRATSFGTNETFYLPLRPSSTSKLSINGLSPTSLDKAFKVSQSRQAKYYNPLYSYYSMSNSPQTIKFIDNTTSEDVVNYPQWKEILKDSIATFNSCLNISGINAHIEEVTEGTSNGVVFQNIENDLAGLCEYHTNENNFLVRVSNNPMIVNGSLNKIKSTIVHEFGHLLGFNDSAYAYNDSIYSYARDKEYVTYFQPNDIATLLSW